MNRLRPAMMQANATAMMQANAAAMSPANAAAMTQANATAMTTMTSVIILSTVVHLSLIFTFLLLFLPPLHPLLKIEK